MVESEEYSHFFLDIAFPHPPRSTPSETILHTLFMVSAGPDLLQICLDLLLLEIQFAFDLPQHFIVDATLIAQSDHSSSLG